MRYDDCHFIGQGTNEVILFRSHRHVLRLIIGIAEQLLLYLGIAIVAGIVGYIFIQTFKLEYNQYIINTYFSLIFLTIVTTVMSAWSFWYRSVCIITDSRIVKIVPKGFFYNYTRELKLYGIKDTSFSYEDFLQGVFNYGKLQVIGGGQFLVKYIPNPRDLHHYITKLVRIMDAAKGKDMPLQLPEFIPRPEWQGKKFTKHS